MAGDLAQTLLMTEQPRRCHLAFLAVACLAAAVGARRCHLAFIAVAFLAAAVGAYIFLPGDEGGQSGTSFPDGENTTQCWQMTGVTCRFFGCDQQMPRRQECYSKNWGDGYSCICSDGFCAGADGVCHPQQNMLVASNFTVSAKYGDDWYYLRAKACHTGALNSNYVNSPTQIQKYADAQCFWSLFQLPAARGADVSYLLIPDALPDCVMSLDSQQSPNAFQSKGPWHQGTSSGGASSSAITFLKQDGGGYKLQISDEGFFATTIWNFYISLMSGTFVSGDVVSLWQPILGDVGEAGTWYVTPTLPVSVGRTSFA